jgi:hypothetical protein
MRRRSRQLVVDASIAFSAGTPEKVFPTSVHCREFLSEILKWGYSLVWSREIAEEWNRRASKFAVVWRVEMARKGRVIDLPDLRDDGLREAIDAAAPTAKARRILRKDVHLMEAAQATERTVTSLDEEARSCFVAVCSKVPTVGAVVWVNPDLQEETPVVWLRSGAKPQKGRTLARYYRKGT